MPNYSKILIVQGFSFCWIIILAFLVIPSSRKINFLSWHLQKSLCWPSLLLQLCWQIWITLSSLPLNSLLLFLAQNLALLQYILSLNRSGSNTIPRFLCLTVALSILNNLKYISIAACTCIWKFKTKSCWHWHQQSYVYSFNQRSRLIAPQERI